MNLSTAIYLDKVLNKIRYITILNETYVNVFESLNRINPIKTISSGFNIDNLDILKGIYSKNESSILIESEKQEVLNLSIIYNSLNSDNIENVYMYGYILLNAQNGQVYFEINKIESLEIMYSNPDLNINYSGNDIILYSVIIKVIKSNTTVKIYKIHSLISEKKYNNLIIINDINIVGIIYDGFIKIIKSLNELETKMYNQYYEIVNKWINLDIWDNSFNNYWNLDNPGKMPNNLKTYININFNTGLI